MKFYLTKDVYLEIDSNGFLKPSAVLEISGGMQFEDIVSLLDNNDATNFIKSVSLSGWEYGAKDGESHVFKVNDVNVAEINSNGITANGTALNPPQLTTTERNALAGERAGTIIWNTTDSQLQLSTDGAGGWVQIVTS